MYDLQNDIRSFINFSARANMAEKPPKNTSKQHRKTKTHPKEIVEVVRREMLHEVKQRQQRTPFRNVCTNEVESERRSGIYGWFTKKNCFGGIPSQRNLCFAWFIKAKPRPSGVCSLQSSTCNACLSSLCTL